MQSSLKHIIRSFQHHATTLLTTQLVLAGVFTVFAGGFLLYKNMDRILSQWGEDLYISVFINDDVNEASQTNLRKALAGLEGVREINFVSKDVALEKFRKQMQNFAPDLVNSATYTNPLPASFEVRVAESVNSTANGLENLARKISNQMGVSDVAYGQNWVKSYASLVTGFSNVAGIVFLVMILGSLLMVGNAIKSSISQRQNEIEILELVGATKEAIRFPFLMEGAFLGLTASTSAMLLTYLVFETQIKNSSAGPEFWAIVSQATFLSYLEIGLFLLAGPVMGVVGSFLCLLKANDGWAAAKRSEIPL